jgi:homocysteine S-methyltransferase
MERECGVSPGLASPVLGLQANTSPLPPHELDARAELDADPPEPFAEAMASLDRDLGMRVLGGCCGSDARHLCALAERLAAGTGAAGRPG